MGVVSDFLNKKKLQHISYEDSMKDFASGGHPEQKSSVSKLKFSIVPSWGLFYLPASVPPLPPCIRLKERFLLSVRCAHFLGASTLYYKFETNGMDKAAFVSMIHTYALEAITQPICTSRFPCPLLENLRRTGLGN
jgi:hypothetical protein